MFVNRLDLVGLIYENRNDNMDLSTILFINGQSVPTVFGNTGDLAERKNFTCMLEADALYAESLSQTTDYVNIGEIWIYGYLK